MEVTRNVSNIVDGQDHGLESTQNQIDGEIDQGDVFESLDLAVSLLADCKAGPSMANLDTVIFLFREVLERCPVSHPLHYDAMCSLASAMGVRFLVKNEQTDLEGFEELGKRIIANTSTGMDYASDQGDSDIKEMVEIGKTLLAELHNSTSMSTIESIIFLVEQSLPLFPFSHPKRGLALITLAYGLCIRFNHLNGIEDLKNAMSSLQETHAKGGRRESDGFQFDDNGISLDLRNALSAVSKSRGTIPTDEGQNEDVSLFEFGSQLAQNFATSGNIDDLDQGIALMQQGLTEISMGDPNYAVGLNNLANELWTLFEQRGESQDLDEAISFHTQALELTPPPHPDRSGPLNNLAAALLARFTQQGRSQDLDEAISFHTQALELTPPPHPNRSASLNNLANALTTRFEQRGESLDLNEAISLYNQACEIFPPEHSHHAGTLGNLGMLHMAAYERVGGDPSHLEQAMLLFSRTTQSIFQSPSKQFHAATRWARQADLHQHHSALEAYGAALYVLPQLATLGLDIQSRQDALTKGTDGIARKAAKCAIRVRSFDKALEYLETGRGVFWSQFLHLRSPFDQLDGHSVEITKELRRISSELERGSHRDMPHSTLDNRKKLSLEEEAQYFVRLSREWSETLEKVRKLKGFEGFLLPRRISTLKTAAKEHPIVYLVANDDNSDCLIVTSTSVHHISLPEVSSAMLFACVKLIQIAASDSQIPRSLIKELVKNGPAFSPTVFETLQFLMDPEEERGMRRETSLPAYISSDDIFNDVLAFLWDQAVKPVIDFMNLQKSDTPPTLTWCPTGLFTFLPIHAAGRYNEGLVDCASDYIVSSYTPTIGVLLSQDPIPLAGPFKMLAVIQSRSLPSTRRELEKIEQHATRDSLIKFGVPGAPASVDAIARSLSAASIVHFACHGNQDPSRPLDSGLQIEDEVLTISRIMKESVPNGSLAFLRACETAKGDEKVPDEAMSLAASLLFSGFRSVVATMWRMWDEDGPVIADAFYRELFRGPNGVPMQRPDISKSAQALHIAVKELRSQGVPFKRWVPFIHMGK